MLLVLAVVALALAASAARGGIFVPPGHRWVPYSFKLEQVESCALSSHIVDNVDTTQTVNINSPDVRIESVYFNYNRQTASFRQVDNKLYVALKTDCQLNSRNIPSLHYDKPSRTFTVSAPNVGSIVGLNRGASLSSSCAIKPTVSGGGTVATDEHGNDITTQPAVTTNEPTTQQQVTTQQTQTQQQQQSSTQQTQQQQQSSTQQQQQQTGTNGNDGSLPTGPGQTTAKPDDVPWVTNALGQFVLDDNGNRIPSNLEERPEGSPAAVLRAPLALCAAALAGVVGAGALLQRGAALSTAALGAVLAVSLAVLVASSFVTTDGAGVYAAAQQQGKTGDAAPGQCSLVLEVYKELSCQGPYDMHVNVVAAHNMDSLPSFSLPHNERGCVVAGRPFVADVGEDGRGDSLVADVAAAAAAATAVGGDAAAWAEPATAAASVKVLHVADERAAERWTRGGLGEHASVASFAAFALRLMAVGAPPALVDDALRAARDEVRHARDSFALAAVHGAPAGTGPGALRVPGGAVRVGDSLRSLALATAREGCVAEALSVVEAAADAAAAGDDAADRAVLDSIVADEARHAALALRTVRWALSRDAALAEPLRDAFEDALRADPRGKALSDADERVRALFISATAGDELSTPNAIDIDDDDAVRRTLMGV